MKSYSKRLGALLMAVVLVTALSFQAFGMQIFIKGFEKILVLEIEPTDLIDSIFSEVEEKTGVPQNKIKLYFKGNELEKGKSLSDYNIQKDSELLAVLITSITISVYAESESYKLTAELGDTIAAVKEQLAEQTGIESSRLVLQIGDVTLENDKTLESYGIEEGDTLTLTFTKDPEKLTFWEKLWNRICELIKCIFQMIQS